MLFVLRVLVQSLQSYKQCWWFLSLHALTTVLVLYMMPAGELYMLDWVAAAAVCS
jgi:hypothetical protein